MSSSLPGETPYPTGQECIVIYDPKCPANVGREIAIASQYVSRANNPGPGAECIRGLLCQHVRWPGVSDFALARSIFPVRWMVPKGVNPDPAELTTCSCDELTHEDIEAFHRIAELLVADA